MSNSKVKLRWEPVALTLGVFRNLPDRCTHESLINLMNQQGFGGQFEVLHMDLDQKSRSKQACVNVKDADAAAQIWRTFNGITPWELQVDPQVVCLASELHAVMHDSPARVPSLNSLCSLPEEMEVHWEKDF